MKTMFSKDTAVYFTEIIHFEIQYMVGVGHRCRDVSPGEIN
jgi:hypothetical protein